MKRLLAVLCLLVLIISIPISCRRSSGDDGPPVVPPGDIIVPPGPGPRPETVPITFTTPQQAAGSTAAIDGMQALSSAQFAAIMELGLSSQPPGFAPAVSRSTGAIAKVDPSLAMMVTEMQRLAASPTVQRAVKKARALQTALATAVSTTLSLEFCSNEDGTVHMEGQNNFDEAANPSLASDYTLVFTNCKDDIELTRLTGTLHIEDASSTDNAGVKSSLLATNLALEQFSSIAYDVMTKKSVLNGAFVKNDQVNLVDDEGGGTFVVTTPAGGLPEKVVTYTYDGLHVESQHTHNADATDSIVATTKGSFKVTSTSGGVKTFELNFAMDLAEQRIQLNDTAGTERSLLSGSIDIAYAPEMAASGCQTGKVTISTVAPREFTTAGGACPHKGTVNLNNATINYDPGQPIRVSVVGAAPQTFADCAALDASGGACTF